MKGVERFPNVSDTFLKKTGSEKGQNIYISKGMKTEECEKCLRYTRKKMQEFFYKVRGPESKVVLQKCGLFYIIIKDNV